MRLPNGYGSVHRLPGNRRKPYRARVTVSWKTTKDNTKKQEYQTIGYFESKEAALLALAKFHKSPYDLKFSEITFAELYQLWSEEHFQSIVPSAKRVWEAAYHHSESLFSMKFREIRTLHLETAIGLANVGNATKVRMKSLYSMMYKFAMKNDIVDKNYAALCRTPKVEKMYERVPFSDEEIGVLWKNLEVPYVDMILVGIYSGWRPRELVELETKNIDLENEIMIGGIKTEAGRDRVVPIHSAIYDLIKSRYDAQHERIFLRDDGRIMTYDDYRNRFRKIMKLLGMNHKPHDVRHTFVTLAKRYEVNEYALKLMVGHAIQDITEKVYTHRTAAELKKEIEKIACVLRVY